MPTKAQCIVRVGVQEPSSLILESINVCKCVTQMIYMRMWTVEENVCKNAMKMDQHLIVSCKVKPVLMFAQIIPTPFLILMRALVSITVVWVATRMIWMIPQIKDVLPTVFLPTLVIIQLVLVFV